MFCVVLSRDGFHIFELDDALYSNMIKIPLEDNIFSLLLISLQLETSRPFSRAVWDKWKLLKNPCEMYIFEDNNTKKSARMVLYVRNPPVTDRLLSQRSVMMKKEFPSRDVIV